MNKYIFMAIIILTSIAHAGTNFKSDSKMLDGNTIKNPVVVSVSGKISEGTASSFRNSMDAAQRTGQDIIPIVISSYGGSVYALLEMIDVINVAKKRGFKIATIVTGKAMSAAAVLFTFGDEGYRFIGPSATVMIHDVATMTGGKIGEIKASAEEGDRLNIILFETMSTNIGKNKGYLYDIVHSKGHADWFLNAKDAVNHNIANKISVPDINVDVDIKIIIEQ